MKTHITLIDRIMAAVTFAEANEPATGKEFLTGTKCKSERELKRKHCETFHTNDLHGAEVHS